MDYLKRQDYLQYLTYRHKFYHNLIHIDFIYRLWLYKIRI